MNNFTFSNPTDKKTMIETEYDSWSEKIKSHQNSFGKDNTVKFGAWTRRIRKDDPNDNGNSTTPLPELWEKTQLPPTHKSKYSYNSTVGQNNTMMKYRKEMMELVKEMPETAYELSLRDIVETPTMLTPLKEGKIMENNTRRGVARSESLDSGVFSKKKYLPRIPSFLGGGGKKSKGKNGSVGAKVTPKPSLGDGDKSGSDKSVDREWWNEDFGSKGSSNSSSGRRKNTRKLSGCYPLFQTRF